VALDPWIVLEENSYLGVNTYLFSVQSSVEVDARIEATTILTEPDEL